MNKSSDVSYNTNGAFAAHPGFTPSAPYMHDNNAVTVRETRKPKKQTISIFWLPAYILPWAIIFLLMVLSYHILPNAITQEKESSYPNRFIGQRAKRLNQELANIGPKVVGSETNELTAVQFLMNEIDKIKRTANPIHLIEDDIQSSSGDFNIGASTTYYQGIQNVVVKISPRNRTTAHSLLINSHFDSVPGSPGAGDAGILVSVMLEVLRVLSQLPDSLQHAVVFLFNSAEEFQLNGSHQFITKHMWAGDLRAVINMDSCGTGGREILFQSTAYTWLMNAYKKSVPHPTASVLGDELFKSGIIPSDTDFRIFRDFGNLRGLDFAIYRNGYIYHTKHDSPDIIPASTFQNTGDNILAVTIAVANSDELGSDKYEDEDGDLVFFDFINWFMISYTKTVAIVINVVVSVVALIGVVISLFSFGKACRLSFWRMSGEFVAVVLIQVISIVLAAGIVILLAFVYDKGSRSMSWYSSPWIMFGIYYCPLFFGLGILPSLYVMFRKTDTIRQSYFAQMFQHAQCLLLVLITLGMTALGIRSTFIVVITLIFYALTTYINCFTRLQLRDSLWIIVNAIGQVIPFMFYSYYTLVIFELFIPIQGRNGATDNPDMMLGIIVIGFGILMAGLIIPSLYMFKRSALVILGFLVVFVVFGIVMATNIGFPYRAAVSPKRFWIFHTERTFHDFDGNIRLSDSGYFMRGMDRHSDDFVSDYVPKMKNAEKASLLCNSEMMCAMPSYQSMVTSTLSEYSLWIPSSSPNLPYKTSLTLRNEISLSANTSRFEFELRGTDHMAVSISPLVGNSLTSWSFSATPLERNWGIRKLYYVTFVYGSDRSPINFELTVEKSSSNGPSFDIAVVSHFTYHKDGDTPEYKEFLESFPDWAHLTSWTSTYDSWRF